jgi:hypothetical protein
MTDGPSQPVVLFIPWAVSVEDGQEQDRGTACYAEFEYIYVYPALFIKLTEEIAPRSRPPWFH